MCRWRLGIGDVDRLAGHGTGVVQGRRQIGELVEFLQVGERGIAPLVVEVIDERRAVSGPERYLVAADLGAALGVAGAHGEAFGVLGDQCHEQLARDPHPVAVDLGAGIAPHLRGLGVAELDADLLEDVERSLVDPLQALLAENLVDRDLAVEHGQCRDLHRGPLLASGLATAPPALARCSHHLPRHATAGPRRALAPSIARPARRAMPGPTPSPVIAASDCLPHADVGYPVARGGRRTPGLSRPAGSRRCLAAASASPNSAGRCRSYQGMWSRPTAW